MADNYLTPARAISRPHSISLLVQHRLLIATLLVADVIMLELAFMIAYRLRFDVQLTLAPGTVPSPLFYTQLVTILIPLLLLLFSLFQLYTVERLLGGTEEYSRIFNACTIGIMVVVMVTFVVPTFVVARGWLIASWLLSALFVGVSRFFIRRVVYRARTRGYFTSATLIIGANEEAELLAQQIQEHSASGLHVIGLVAGLTSPFGTHSIPLLGTLDEIESIVNQHEVREIIVASSALSREELLALFERINLLQDVELRLSSGLFEVLATGMTVKSIGNIPLMTLNKLRLDPIEQSIKTVMDYAIAIGTLIVLSPLLITIACLVKFDSPGPIIYRRRVLGLGGREFDAYKFRTMYIDGDKILADHPALQGELQTNHKLKVDPRVTRVGQWLRRYSLDEWPQLFNVLRGQMSLVGPRMISPEEAKEYGRLRINLLTVKPGITGLWQVSGRSEISYEERVRLDTQYIRTYTIWRDLQILFIETPPVVLNGKGAY